MRRIVLWFASTVAALLLLAGYHTSFAGPLAAPGTTSPYSAGVLATRETAGHGGAATTSQGPGSAPSAGPGSGGTGSGGTGSGGAGSGATAATSTVTGDTVQTAWGPVQVQVSVAGSRITGVAVLQYPTGNSTDAQINGYALPILVDETMKTQGAQIDMVSGATYTSGGYQQSLQSALDRAGL